MVTHIIPCTGTALDPSCGGPAWAGPAEAVGNAPATHESEPAGPSTVRHGPLRVALHAAPRRQGPGLDSGPVSRRARARRLRRALLLSDARPPGARCRRQCVVG